MKTPLCEHGFQFDKCDYCLDPFSEDCKHDDPYEMCPICAEGEPCTLETIMSNDRDEADY